MRLSVCDAEGREVGTSSVVIREDASVHMEFGINEPVAQPAISVAVFVRGKLMKRWTSVRVCMCVCVCLCVWRGGVT